MTRPLLLDLFCCQGGAATGYHRAGNVGRKTGMALGWDIKTDDWRRAMGIDWMTGKGMAQAIPPAYTEHIGAMLLAELAERAA